ncbi:MAG TPA: SDR family NAD(P)-dependent oxidoreductase [Acidimicrobiales bacterium]|nr:SDR family NAD(P)-dependent oxidoreductase [Acidimicrobiales bacterium]
MSIDPGSVAVVTGASTGLGRRMALDLAARGAVVTAVARSEDRLQAVAADMRRSSPESAYRVCDVSDTGAYVSLLGELERQHGRIDLLVNNAGVGEEATEGDALDRHRALMETNYFAAVAGTLAVLPGMLERGSGSIVNVSSDAARAPAPGEPAYSASKAALSAFTEGMSFEAEAKGVHLHVLYPGWVPTAMGQGAVDAGMPMPPKAVRRTEEQVSRAVLAGAGGPRLEIDVTRVARLAPVARVLAPRLYRRALRASTG